MRPPTLSPNIALLLVDGMKSTIVKLHPRLCPGLWCERQNGERVAQKNIPGACFHGDAAPHRSLACSQCPAAT
jgi:hypothetical protein